MGSHLLTIDFRPQSNLEYIVTDNLDDLPSIKPQRFQVISEPRARKIYFRPTEARKKVYVVSGGQRGDEGKGKVTKTLIETITTSNFGDVSWALAPNSTHNAGKGIHTTNEAGEDVQVSLHLCPATLVDPSVHNYIARETQVNLFKLEEEVVKATTATGRNVLGKNYHLTVDRHANLLIPLNRADDVVGKKNALGSTIAGATSSREAAEGKKAPYLEQVLYDHKGFKRQVQKQITEFDSRVAVDTELNALNITDMYTLGIALQDDEIVAKNDRLRALKRKLSADEVTFFSHTDPAQFLLEKYQAILDKDLFNIGDVAQDIDDHLVAGQSGIIECVQSCLLDGHLLYSRNRTAARTSARGSIGDAGLDHDKIKYVIIPVFKFGNTAVGGNEPTMSGFISQDRLSEIYVPQEIEKGTETVSFEMYGSIRRFLSQEQVLRAFTEVNTAFTQALKEGHSLHNTKVHVPGINYEFSLAEARAIFSAEVFGERGVTSGRYRTCRIDDEVEEQVVFDHEQPRFQVRNAVDRAMYFEEIPLITAYQVAKTGYRGLTEGRVILPGEALLMEHRTVEHCVPTIAFLPSWQSLGKDGAALKPGVELDENLSRYLSIKARHCPVIAIGTSSSSLCFIEAIE